MEAPLDEASLVYLESLFRDKQVFVASNLFHSLLFSFEAKKRVSLKSVFTRLEQQDKQQN